MVPKSQAHCQQGHGLTQLLKVIVERFGYRAIHPHFFDTLTLDVTGAVPSAQALHAAATKAGVNFRIVDAKHVGITLDESVGPVDFLRIVNAFSASVGRRSARQRACATRAHFGDP